jgi:phosphoglycolate phosphatase-like HAD superfamily hydrolase
LIKTILFDVDGVLLSEEHYFDASALTVWELLISNNYLALSPDEYKIDNSKDEISGIRELVFENDQVLKFLKSRGLNANWDMIYLTFSYQLIHLLAQIKDKEYESINKWCLSPIDRNVLLEMGKVLGKYEVTVDYRLFLKDFQRSTGMKGELFNFLNVLAKEKLGIDTAIFSEKGALWSVCEHVSQEWYVGDENVVNSTGRPSVQLGKLGYLANETTLASRMEIDELFASLVETGFTIGIGTGRPRLETVLPFGHLDWLKHFDNNRIITADEVFLAENEHPEKKSLSKPHPITYIMAVLGKQTPVTECLNVNLPIKNGEEILVVGDSLADLLAARQMGCKFAAVLTGLSGKDARSEFENQQADYILDSVLDIKGILEFRCNL